MQIHCLIGIDDEQQLTFKFINTANDLAGGAGKGLGRALVSAFWDDPLRPAGA